MKYFIFILFPLSIYSQNITGKVYDNDTTVKGIDVFNLSKKTRTYTDNYGSFTIKASIGDTLSFHSIFHNKKIIKLTETDFNDVIVIELRKTINRLNEILIQNNIKPKEFNQEQVQKTFEEQTKEDIKRNPHKYGTSSKYGLDIVRVAKLIGKLLKKDKIKNASTIPLSHKDLDSLFSNNTFFNETLLINDLAIPKDYKHLFFEYCETKNLNKTFLSKKNDIILLDSLISYSKSFLKIIEESKKK